MRLRIARVLRKIVFSASSEARDRNAPRTGLCPGISDMNFRYCQGVIDLDAEISDRAFNLGKPKQELDSPQVACPPMIRIAF
jgi:hypothetical protein